MAGNNGAPADAQLQQQAPVDPFRSPPLAKFTGYGSIIRADLWINLFEVVTRHRSDGDRLSDLMAFLTDDALNWYATDVAPGIAHLTWNAVKADFVSRFGQAVVDPLTEAQDRRLRISETVETYYNEKLRLLRRCNLNDMSIVGQLTKGMPAVYKGYLVCSAPNTPLEWLTICKQLEVILPKPDLKKIGPVSSFAGPVRTPAQVRFSQPVRAAAAASATIPKERAKNKSLPSTACRYCLEAGEPDQFHWHRLCPRKPKVQAVSATEEVDAQEAEAIATIAGNFLCDRH